MKIKPFTMKIKPLITEKSTEATAQTTYTFEVDKKATKSQIKKAIAEEFKVDVVRVRTMNLKKQKRQKKAYVEIKNGQKI